MKTCLIPIIYILCSSFQTFAQVYPDYFGTGNDVGITVTSSNLTEDSTSLNTLNGTGYLLDQVGASRFLAQGTLGANMQDIETLTQMTIQEWIDWQINMPYTSLFDYTEQIFDSCYHRITVANNNIKPSLHSVLGSRRGYYSSFAFYQKAITEKDKLRQKVAFSLSQILVITGGDAYGRSSYYDILLDNAFGNYRDLLHKTSLHPQMGITLSHLENAKSNGVTEPDENYARELMQLFSIGLYELNTDGSHKLDSNGEKIATYNNEDVENLARVFTGLSGGGWDTIKVLDHETKNLNFYNYDYLYDITIPMRMVEIMHDSNEKTFLGSTLPANQNGLADINQAIDVIFNHPNVGPFIALRLIQQLVKSNPSPQYIYRVASVFNNNGNGIRGDMKATITSILTDIEARNCELIESDITTGRLIQPIEKLTKLAIGLDIYTANGSNEFWFYDSWNTHENHYKGYKQKLGQSFLGSPSVFNFFTPFYKEGSVIDPSGLVSPEFQILDPISALHYINFTLEMPILPFYCSIKGTTAGMSFHNPADYTRLDFTFLESLIPLNDSNQISDYNPLLNRLDLILCNGRLLPQTKSLVLNTIVQYKKDAPSISNKELIQDAVGLILLTPEFQIIK